MDADAARSLAAYINQYSHRYCAEILEYQEQVWVLVRNQQQYQNSPYIEPILHLTLYLARTDRALPLADDYRILLEGWQDNQKPEAAKAGCIVRGLPVSEPHRKDAG